MPNKKRTPLKFSVPYNNDFGLLKELIKIKNLNGNKIEEIYLSPPQEYFGSCRICNRFSRKDFKIVLDFCQKNNLKVNLLLNSQNDGAKEYLPQNINKLLKFIKEAQNNFNLNFLTIANPFFIQKIRENIKGVKIVVSVNSYVDSVQRALFFEKMGADVLTIHRDINRDLKLLKDIKKAVKCELKLLVNEGCLFKCPMKIFHDNWTSYGSKEFKNILGGGSSYDWERIRLGLKKDFFMRWCQDLYKSDLSQILKSPWIRPEDLRKYQKITNFFKIADRYYPTARIINAVKSYLNEFYNGNFIDLLPPSPLFIKNKDLNGFFEKVASCDKNCSECPYCEKLAKKIIKKIKI